MKKIIFLPLFALATSYELEIYNDTAIMSQILADQASKINLKVPAYLNENMIEVVASCDIKSINLSKEMPAENENLKANKEFMLKKSKIENEIKALNMSNIALKDFMANQKDDIQKAGENFKELVFKNFEQISNLEREISELKKPNDITFIKELEITFECEPKNVKISYPNGLEYSLKTEAIADTKANNVEISQNLFIKNKLGFDLQKLSVKIYPFSYTSSVNPSEFYPDFEEEHDHVAYEATNFKMVSRLAETKSYSVNRAKTEFSNSWVIDNISLKDEEKREFLYDKQSLQAKFDIFIDAYASSSAFTRAVFTPKVSINTDASFILNGVKVSNNNPLNLISGKENELFFGKNMLINIDKKPSKIYTDVSFFSNSKKVSKAWEYNIKNNSDRAWQITLVEKMPISASSNVKIKDLSSKAADIFDQKSGKSSFILTLKPEQDTSLVFGYEITKPNKQ